MSDVGIVVDLDDQTIEQNKVVLDYTSRDFVAIRTQLIGLAKGFMPEWQTVGEAGDFGTLLLELFSYMGDVMHFYIDRTASEAFLGTAVRRQSILYMADMMGYTPIGQQAASVKLTVTMQPDDPDHEGTVVTTTLPKSSQVYNSAGNADETILFELDADVTVNPGESVTAYATEGLSLQAVSLGLCQGVPNTEFVIPHKGVVFNTVQVQTREGYQVVDWTSFHHLASARPTQAVFTTFLDEAGYTHVVFGDNTSGRIPPINAEVFVNYRFGVGAVANNLAANSVDTIAPIADVDTFGITVTNPETPVGGSDAESVDSMRFSISRGGSRIRDRAVTLLDYADLAMQVPGVAKSVAYGTVYTAVFVRVAPPNGQATGPYMVNLCTSVEAYLSDKIMIGSTVHAVPQDVAELWQDVYIQAIVHVQDAYNRTTVRLQVDSVVRSLLSFDSVDFGYRVSQGMLYRAMLAVQGVEYVELDWLSTTAPVDDTDPGAGDTAITVVANWRHNTSTNTTVTPGSGLYTRNSTTTPTEFALSTTAADGTTPTLANLKVGDHLVYRPALDPGSWMSFVISAAPTSAAGFFRVPVTKLDQATVITPPGNNDVVAFEAIRYLPTPDSFGGVADIATDELLIPRIAPPPPVKTATVTSVAASGGTATVITTTPHGMLAGQTVDITGVTSATFNGRFLLLTAAASTLTFALAGTVTLLTTPGTVTTVNMPESPTDYPDLTEDERTHDGLWVKAVGGLPNT